MYQIRLAKPEDFNFVANSYLKSYRCSPEARPMINDIYYPEYKTRLEYMTRTATILVACATDDEDQIFGYLITSLVGNYPLVHYVYVKAPFRCLGIAKSLAHVALPELGTRITVVTHQPRNFKSLATKYALLFDPKYTKELI